MAQTVTDLLSRLTNGDRSVLDQLLPSIHDHLHAMAMSLVNRERRGHTLCATALVNEAYLKLVDQHETRWQDKAHFLAVAGQAMRCILVDHARRRNRIKRGGGNDKVCVDLTLLEEVERSAGVDIEALDNALCRLAAIRPRAQQVVDMRFFGSMTVNEIASVLEMSVSTVEREWRYARAWLKCALGDSPE